MLSKSCSGKLSIMVRSAQRSRSGRRPQMMQSSGMGAFYLMVYQDAADIITWGWAQWLTRHYGLLWLAGF
jgi:hypothetical protein